MPSFCYVYGLTISSVVQKFNISASDAKILKLGRALGYHLTYLCGERVIEPCYSGEAFGSDG